jgi:predicted metal-dependent phosphoesterase TrpH
MDYLQQFEIRLSSLTDHNTQAGTAEFRSRGEDLGIETIAGIEIDIPWVHFDIHVLCYGFDSGDKALDRYVTRINRNPPITTAAKRERFQELRDIVHSTGGLLYLAHPLAYPGDAGTREKLVFDLKDDGIDGIEALYSPYSAEEQELLLKWADTCDLAVSGGSDFHRIREKAAVMDFPGVLTVRRAREPGISFPTGRLGGIKGLVRV